MTFGSVGPKSRFSVGVVGGGSSKESLSKEQDSSHVIYNPLTQNPQTVPLTDLALSMLSHTPSGFSQQSFQGGMDPGTLIYYISQEGFPGGLIIGQGSPIHGEGASDNQHIQKLKSTERNINTPPDVQESQERGAKVRKIVESGKQHKLEILDGFPIHGALFDMAGFRIPETKDIPTAKQHNTEMMRSSMLGQLNSQISSLGGMLKGLMTGNMGGSGGSPGSLGFGGAGSASPTNTGTVPLNQLSNIKGGLSYDSLINVSPGTIIFANVVNPVLGNVDANTLNANIELANSYIELNTINRNANLDNVIYNVSQNAPHMVPAIKNLPLLVPGLEMSGAGSFVLGGAVHAPTYLQNAHDLLSQVTSMDDLMNVLKRLQFDESLFGLDKLDRLEIIRTTPWVDSANSRIGTVKQTLFANGDFAIQYSNTALRVINDFANNTSNTQVGSSNFGNNPFGSGSGGGGGGGAGAIGGLLQQGQSIIGNMFGKSSDVMNDMMKRLHPGGEKASKQLTEKLSNKDQKTKKLMDIAKATLEGNPLEEKHYDKNSGGMA